MISVVIPVYNTARYLGRCIDSVLASVYRDFEILLVDDGSEDDSPNLCRDYAEKERCIQYIRQEHQGVSAARNRGIKKSRGEWIVFVDADDFISPAFLGMVAEEEYQNYDLLVFDSVWLKQKRLGERTAEKRKRLFSWNGRKDAAALIENMLRFQPLASSGGSAYKRTVIERYAIRFPTGIRIGEDQIFNAEYWLHMDSHQYIPEAIYFIEQRLDSATHAYYPDYLENAIDFERQLNVLLEKHNIFSRVESAYFENALINMAAVLIRGIFSPYSDRSYQENCILCRNMRENEIFNRALVYNKKNGVWPRRILLRCFELKRYRVASWICKISFIYLYSWRRM